MSYLVSLIRSREIYRIHAAHTIRSLALSFVGIYIPIFLLVRGHSLREVILFYVVLHLTGLLFTFLITTSLIEKWGLIKTFKLYYPFEIVYFVLLYSLTYFDISIWLIAAIGGISNFAYWVPLNILLIKHVDVKKIGSDLATFFALPKFFKIVSPLLSAALVLFVGFWPVFVIAMCGVVISYLPLASISKSEVSVSLKLRETWSKLKKRKGLFFLEGFDNIIEECEWFWSIFVYLMIGSLSTPGVVGSLQSLGGALFTLCVGKYVNRGTHKPIVIGAVAFAVIWFARIFASSPFSAYALTVLGSFVMTLFLVSYFSMIFRSVKNDDEEEFLILREIPTVLGRMVVFGVILLAASSLHFFFILPILAIVVFLVFFLLHRERLTTQA